MPLRQRTAAFAGLALAAALAAAPASARALSDIKSSGVIVVCAHPNSLPFARKDGKRHGFQVEMAEALAKELGVKLERDWVITRYDLFRTQCDLVMDSIADREAQAESGLQLSKPYRRSGVALAVRASDKKTRSLDDLRVRKVGVLTSSIAAMTLDQRGIDTVPGLFEDEMLEMLVKGEVDAAAVTGTSIGYYNLRHPDAKLRLIDAFAGDADLSWNVAVGMRRPDAELIQAVDDALTRMVAQGTVKRVFAHYGVELVPPR
jgi:polar amino acid transport system substrate-binding protein